MMSSRSRSRNILIHFAMLSALASGCSSEDSVMQPTSSPMSGSGAGQSGGTAGSANAGTVAGAPRAGIAGGIAGSTAGTGTAGGAAGMNGSAAGSTAGGTSGTGSAGSSSGGTGGGASGTGAMTGTGAAQDADCDMNGFWISRMLTVTDALSADQCASLYSFYELRQVGPNVEVVNHFDCGLRASGSGDAAYSPATRGALLALNNQVGRKGTMMKGADGTCQLNMEPFWYVLGAEPSYVPSERNSTETFAMVQSAHPLPSTKGAAGLVDVENDGKAGVATVVTNSAVTGTRHGVIRNVQTWKTDSLYKIMPSMTWDSDIDARLSYIGEENAIEAYDEQGADSPFLTTLAVPQPQADAARITLHFLGRDAADSRVKEVVVGSDRSDVTGALSTCDKVIEKLKPILPIYGAWQRCPCPNGKAADANRMCTP